MIGWILIAGLGWFALRSTQPGKTVAGAVERSGATATLLRGQRLPPAVSRTLTSHAASGNEPAQAVVNSNVIKYGGGVLKVGEVNIPYQQRDPGEATQPPLNVVTQDFFGDPTDILLATLPGKTRRLPPVSLGPSVTQQQQYVFGLFVQPIGGGSPVSGGGAGSVTGRAVEGFE